MPNPLLTLIIPTHTRSHLLQRTLDSINQQTARESIEIIVVADVSDTETNRICQIMLTPNDIYIRRSGLPGPSASRNLALKIARGCYIMFLDDDDTLDTQFMENLLQHSKIEPWAGPFYFNCNIVKESRPKSGPIPLAESFFNTAENLTINIFVKNQIPICCFVFPSALLKGLEFDTSMRAYEDWDFLLSVFKQKIPTHIPITSSTVFQVDDTTTDRRGSSAPAKDFNAVLDYLYVYRRHPSPNADIQLKRKLLLDSVGLTLPQSML
ncbi:glycosyltransferase family A protein [uncultured Nitrosomonas sp.]|uniref:glycosyltransferase family A protein n=1 Tax=uncultured Nitrosomonas sp. TaxID=156424 RepID=UPI0026055A31|nr:glycosyltransferase family A protein [uncultured Nitrosomonas sp.]